MAAANTHGSGSGNNSTENQKRAKQLEELLSAILSTGLPIQIDYTAMAQKKRAKQLEELLSAILNTGLPIQIPCRNGAKEGKEDYSFGR